MPLQVPRHKEAIFVSGFLRLSFTEPLSFSSFFELSLWVRWAAYSPSVP
jgi:hypothetical protein